VFRKPPPNVARAVSLKPLAPHTWRLLVLCRDQISCPLAFFFFKARSPCPLFCAAVTFWLDDSGPYFMVSPPAPNWLFPFPPRVEMGMVLPLLPGFVSSLLFSLWASRRLFSTSSRMTFSMVVFPLMVSKFIRFSQNPELETPQRYNPTRVSVFFCFVSIPRFLERLQSELDSKLSCPRCPPRLFLFLSPSFKYHLKSRA